MVVTGHGTINNQVIRCTKQINDCGTVGPDLNNDGVDDTRVILAFRETKLNECDGVPGTTNPPGDEFVEYSGLISNAKEDGDQLTASVSESCTDLAPANTSNMISVTLRNATITDPADPNNTVTGDLEIELKGIADGTAPNPVRARFHGTINGVSGQLAGASGEIEIVTPGASTTGATSFYYAKIRVPNL